MTEPLRDPRYAALVCEGPCNPRLAEFEAVWEAKLAEHGRVGLERVLPDATATHRTFGITHTPHRLLYPNAQGGYTWGQCVECGTARRWGV